MPLKIDRAVKAITKIMDITPGTSIYANSHRRNYNLIQAVSELVDNSIDARIPGQVLKIHIDTTSGKFFIEDNGKGMDEDGIRKAMMYSSDENEKDETCLGQYGQGLKHAGLSLGKVIDISTTQAGSTGALIGFIDPKEIISRKNYAQPYTSLPNSTDIYEHGTEITITNLNKVLVTQTGTLRNRIAESYAPFIRNDEVIIKVNKRICKPEPYDLIDDRKYEFDITNEKGQRIHGWFGLLKESSQVKALYGFNTFRNGRLITSYDKMVIQHHSTSARVIGNIHMDFVPVTVDKRDWERSTEEFKAAIKMIEEVSKPIIKMAKDLVGIYCAPKKLKKAVNQFSDKLYGVLNSRDFINKMDEYKIIPEMNNDDNNNKDKLTTNKIERRDPGCTHGTAIPTGTHERNPKKFHDISKRTKIRISGGKEVNFHVDYKPLGKHNPIKIVRVVDAVLMIDINTDFPAYIEHRWYIENEVIESIAYKLKKEFNLHTYQIKEIILRMIYQ